MAIIFKPEGNQQSYAESQPGADDGLICNVYAGCNMGCLYCKPINYVPLKNTNNQKIIDAVEKDCMKLRGDKRYILFCFTSDPYQTLSQDMDITRSVLEIFEKYSMNVQIYTKGGMKACRDFDIIKRNHWKFGSSLSFIDDVDRKIWEPQAASVFSRMWTIKEAHDLGIETWVSVEPIIYQNQAISLVSSLKDHVDFWKFNSLYGDFKTKENGIIDNKMFFDDINSLLSPDKYLMRSSKKDNNK